MIHFCPNCFDTDGTMDSKCKVQGGRTDRQHFYVALWSVHIYFFCEKACFKILEKVDTIGFLATDHFPYLLKPFFKAALIRCFFLVFPVSRQSFFGNLIHTLGPDLYLYPFTLRAHHGGVKCFIAV